MHKKALFIIVPVIAILLIPGYFIAKFALDCNSQYSTARKAKQSQIEEFNNIALLGEQPPQKANVERSGDCIDSKPYVTVSKVYKTNTNGGVAVDAIRSSLKSSGYAITNENFSSEGCKLLYRVQAQKNGVKVYAVAYQNKLKDATCTDGYPTGTSESHFRTQDIDMTKLNLR